MRDKMNVVRIPPQAWFVFRANNWSRQRWWRLLYGQMLGHKLDITGKDVEDYVAARVP